ncbi:MAG: hypothetical protein RIC55_17930 [Pirellulaceae bacterium]
MATADTNDVLNRLLILHHRSLPMYLSYATPYPMTGDEKAREVLGHIVASQTEMVDRIGSLLIERNANVRHGEFPMYFTGLHDLSFEYLVKRMIGDQRRDITQIEACVEKLGDDPLGKALAEESLGAAKAHLDALEELVPQAA